MHVDSWNEEAGEAPLTFLLRPAGSAPTLDRSAGRALEVAHVFGDEIVDIRFYTRGDTVRLGQAADFPVPVDLLPTDGHTFLEHDGSGWVATCGDWAGFVDQGETRTPLGDRLGGGRSVRLGDDETLVVEVGASIFVVREVWRGRRLPVPLLGQLDPVGALVAGAVGVMAALLGLVTVYTPVPPKATVMEDPQYIADIRLLMPKPEVVRTPERAHEAKPGGGGGNGPSVVKPSLSKHTGRDDAKVVHDVMDKLFDGISAQLDEAAVPSDLTAGIQGMIASKGTQSMGVDGLGSGRCLSADCTGIGIATGKDFGPGHGPGRPRGAPGLPTDGTTKLDGKITASGEVITVGGINRSDVDAVVKRHFNEIKYCYTRELQRTPGLAGKVSVKFIIAKDGSVSTATIAKSTLGSAGAESCMTGRFLRMQFPALKGGSIAIINYPFVFAQS